MPGLQEVAEAEAGRLLRLLLVRHGRLPADPGRTHRPAMLLAGDASLQLMSASRQDVVHCAPFDLLRLMHEARFQLPL
jgi:hypothetical protein